MAGIILYKNLWWQELEGSINMSNVEKILVIIYVDIVECLLIENF